MNIFKKFFRYNPFKWHIVSHRGGYLIRKFCFTRLWWGYSWGSDEDWCFDDRKIWFNIEDAQATLASIKEFEKQDKQLFVEQ